MSVLEFILRHMMVFLEDILMKVFLISPFYPEEWSLMLSLIHISEPTRP